MEKIISVVEKIRSSLGADGLRMVIIVVTLYLVFHIIMMAYLKYKMSEGFIYLTKTFDLLVTIHKKKYVSIFQNNNSDHIYWSELFDEGSENFINDTQEQLELDYTTPHQKELLEKMLEKVKQMKSSDFIADYSLT